MRARFAVLAAAGLTLTACTAFGPDRHPPRMPTPEHYSVDAQPTRLPAADSVAQTVTVGGKPVPEWWKAYQSDDLNDLVHEALKNSSPSATAQLDMNAILLKLEILMFTF